MRDKSFASASNLSAMIQSRSATSIPSSAMRRISIAAMRKNGIVSFSIRDNSAIYGAFRLHRFIPPIEPSPALPYLDGSVLRPFSQHGARLIDPLAERAGFNDFGSLDLTAFVQEEAAVNVHASLP